MSNRVSGGNIFPNLAVLQGGAVDVYNTSPYSLADYERLRVDWSGNAARIWTQNDGAGVGRNLIIGASQADGAAQPVVYTQYVPGFFPVIAHTRTSATALTGIAHELGLFNLNAASGVQTAVAISPTFAQAGTATGIALLVNPSGTFGSGGGKLQSWRLGGIEYGFITTAGFMSVVDVGVLSYLAFGSSINNLGDVRLTRDAADTLAQRRDTNAQTLRVYNTYTDPSNNERGVLSWIANQFLVGTQNAGTGTARDLVFITGGVSRWGVAGTSGHLISQNDNTYDFGQSGGNRARTGYFGTSVDTPYLALTDGIAAPGAGAGKARLYVDNADGDLKIVFADGTVKTIVTDT